MKSRNGKRQSASCWVSIAVLSAVVLASSPLRVSAQTFSSGSDGSDLAFEPSGPPGTVVLFDPSQFHGSKVSANIFNFTTITIPQGVTVKLSGNAFNGPVYWLAQGDVSVAGTIDLGGASGHPETANPFARVPSVAGPGGYAGGVGGNMPSPSSPYQAALPGNGPGGGAGGENVQSNAGGGGRFSGNQFLIPLVGGSGGGGGNNGNPANAYFGPGGGAGGGALLIASSTAIVVNGVIGANGGDSGHAQFTAWAGGGSGGAIRLVSNVITGSGTLNTNGGSSAVGGHSGGPGQIRLEAFNIAFSGSVGGTLAQASPFPLLIPTAGPAAARVISINGGAVSPNPNTFPDLTINTASPVDVVIQTQNIPTTATVSLTILDENGVPDTVIQAPPLGSCDPQNVCTTTAQVVFPFGASRGLTKVTWTQ